MYTTRHRFWSSVLACAAALSAFTCGIATEKGTIGYVCFAYRTTSEGGRVEEMKVWVVPAKNGGTEVVTRTAQTTAADEVVSSFFVGPGTWLGLYNAERGNVNLDWINAVAGLGLEPNSRYITPDGGELVTGDKVQVAGLLGIEGTFTRTDVTGIKAVVSLVIAEDPAIRDLLPLPLRAEVKYEVPAAQQGILRVPPGGTTELVFFTRDRAVGGEP